MVNRRRALPAALGEEFSRARALNLGLSPGRLRASDLEIPFRGARARIRDPKAASHDGTRLPLLRKPRSELEDPAKAPHPDEIWRSNQRSRAAAYHPIMPDHQFYAGRTAAVLRQLPAPAASWDDIEIGVVSPRTPPRRSGVRGARFESALADVEDFGGVRLLTPASIWVLLGPRLSLRDRVVLGDAIVRTLRFPGNLRPPDRAAYATVDELAAATRVRRRFGRDLLLEALPLLRTGVSSPPETHTRLELWQAGLPDPELDYDVYDESGRFIGCSELAFPRYRLALEYEGDHHRTEKGQWNRDIQKYRDYEDAGWGTIRVTADLLYRRTGELVAQTRSALVRRGWRP